MNDCSYRDPGDGTRSTTKQFKAQTNLIFKDQTDISSYIIEQEGSREIMVYYPN